MSRYWKKLAARSQETWAIKREIITNDQLQNKHIIDLGSSGGIFEEELVKSNTFYCLDKDKDALSFALNKGYLPVEHDLNTPLPFEDNFFDSIIAFDILEHVIFPEKLIREIKRVLKKDGTLYLSVPNSMNIINRLNFLFGRSMDITDMSHFDRTLFSDHLHLITLKKIKTLFRKYNFIVTTKIYFLQSTIRHKSIRIFQPILTIMNILRLNKLFPTLFSFSFIYICRNEDV